MDHKLGCPGSMALGSQCRIMWSGVDVSDLAHGAGKEFKEKDPADP